MATTYRLTDLGTLGAGFSQGVALNASGQVTGFANAAVEGSHAFLWDGTTMQDLGTVGNPSTPMAMEFPTPTTSAGSSIVTWLVAVTDRFYVAMQGKYR